MKVNNGIEKPRLKCLIYGKPGVGKTIMAGQAMDHPDLGEVLFLPIEGGLLSIADKDPKWIDVGKGPDGRPNGRTLANLEDLVWKLVTKAPGFAEYKTLVIDSVTDLQVRDLEDIVGEEKKQTSSRDLGDIHIGDYGKDTARMRRILRMLRDSDLNVILTALSKEVIPEGKDKPTDAGPALTKSLAESIMGYMDFVWYLYVKQKVVEGQPPEEVRTLLTQTRGVFRAKTRLPSFADKIGPLVQNPNLADLYTTLCAEMEKTK